MPHLRILSNELAEAVKRKLGLGAESFGRKATERAPVWGSIHPSPTDEPATAGGPPEAVVPLTYDRREAARRLRKSKPKS